MRTSCALITEKNGIMNPQAIIMITQPVRMAFLSAAYWAATSAAV